MHSAQKSGHRARVRRHEAAVGQQDERGDRADVHHAGQRERRTSAIRAARRRRNLPDAIIAAPCTMMADGHQDGEPVVRPAQEDDGPDGGEDEEQQQVETGEVVDEDVGDSPRAPSPAALSAASPCSCSTLNGSNSTRRTRPQATAASQIAHARRSRAPRKADVDREGASAAATGVGFSAGGTSCGAQQAGRMPDQSASAQRDRRPRRIWAWQRFMNPAMSQFDNPLAPPGRGRQGGSHRCPGAAAALSERPRSEFAVDNRGRTRTMHARSRRRHRGVAKCRRRKDGLGRG